MPEHFDPEERERIRARLIEQAQNLFKSKGVKAATIAEIARRTGIAKGSFYSFYPSKEALLAELLDSIENQERSKILRSLAALPHPDAASVGGVILNATAGAVKHPLLASLFNDPDFNKIFRTLPEDAKDHLIASDMAFAAQIMSLLAERGLQARVEASVAAGLFRALFLAMAAPEEIGSGAYHEVTTRLATAICEAIFVARTKTEDNR